MGYDLVSTVKSENPIDREKDYWAYYAKEFELLNRQCFQFDVWPRLLSLASSYGWQPMGTLPGPMYFDPDFPDMHPEDWDGSYIHNAGQVVTIEDAANLAMALESALDDIPDFLGSVPKEILISSPDVAQQYADITGNNLIKFMVDRGSTVSVPNVMLSPIEYFGGENKQRIIDFIAFCRKGPFEIW